MQTGDPGGSTRDGTEVSSPSLQTRLLELEERLAAQVARAQSEMEQLHESMRKWRGARASPDESPEAKRTLTHSCLADLRRAPWPRRMPRLSGASVASSFQLPTTRGENSTVFDADTWVAAWSPDKEVCEARQTPSKATWGSSRPGHTPLALQGSVEGLQSFGALCKALEGVGDLSEIVCSLSGALERVVEGMRQDDCAEAPKERRLRWSVHSSSASCSTPALAATLEEIGPVVGRMEEEELQDMTACVDEEVTSTDAGLGVSCVRDDMRSVHVAAEYVTAADVGLGSGCVSDHLRDVGVVADEFAAADASLGVGCVAGEMRNAHVVGEDVIAADVGLRMSCVSDDLRNLTTRVAAAEHAAAEAGVDVSNAKEELRDLATRVTSGESAIVEAIAGDLSQLQQDTSAFLCGMDHLQADIAQLGRDLRREFSESLTDEVVKVWRVLTPLAGEIHGAIVGQCWRQRSERGRNRRAKSLQPDARW
mmetsp:Transcript_74248/g.206313  ORF Transcript_74248/g.206313 Transcript_74248/m.206313 type:complete len:481 (-) Transcript_74248:102-1544(-)